MRYLAGGKLGVTLEGDVVTFGIVVCRLLAKIVVKKVRASMVHEIRTNSYGRLKPRKQDQCHHDREKDFPSD